MVYYESKSWDKHVSGFIKKVDELKLFDKALSESKKVINLIRSLRGSFDSVSMASSLNETSFEALIIAVSSNIER